MATYGVGSYEEPIVVSDEEDAAFVEHELSLYVIDQPVARCITFIFCLQPHRLVVKFPSGLSLRR